MTAHPFDRWAVAAAAVAIALISAWATIDRRHEARGLFTPAAEAR
jgi:hypothetical protein